MLRSQESEEKENFVDKVAQKSENVSDRRKEEEKPVSIWANAKIFS